MFCLIASFAPNTSIADNKVTLAMKLFRKFLRFFVLQNTSFNVFMAIDEKSLLPTDRKRLKNKLLFWQIFDLGFSEFSKEIKFVEK